jgi:hypothetical protein
VIALTDVSPWDWAWFVVFVVVYVPLLVLAVRKMWRDDPRWAKPWLPWSKTRWRGMVRATVPLTFALGFALLLVPVFAVIGDDEATAGSVLVVLLVLVACGVSFLLAATTFLFNWPKVIVPPPRRGDRGYVAGVFRRRPTSRASTRESADESADADESNERAG